MPDRYEALRAALPGATPRQAWVIHDGFGTVRLSGSTSAHFSDADSAYIAAADPTTVRALLAERDAWRALGREQIDACPVPEVEGCDFCARIAALLGES